MFNTGSTNIDPINAKLDEILKQQQQEPDLNITRDEQGRVSSIGVDQYKETLTEDYEVLINGKYVYC